MNKKVKDTAVFVGRIPPITSGIKAGGDGMRVQFDIPETEMGQAAKLLLMRGKALKITVETLTDLDDETKEKAKGGGSGMDRRRYAD